MAWNPETYLQFASPRTRPVADLLAHVPLAAPARVIDLGCGPGNSTALLAAKWPKAMLEGLDSSAAMLAEAKASGVPAAWVQADAGQWAPGQPYDLIFSNAAFQWVDGLDRLMPRLMGFLAPGGVLAFQVPINHRAPSHRLLLETAADPRWAGQVSDGGLTYHEAGDYYDWLRPHAASLDVWETTYIHQLEGEDAVYQWMSGTALRPYLAKLDEAKARDFAADYRRRLAAAYPRRADGTTLFPFQRLFVVAVKS